MVCCVQEGPHISGRLDRKRVKLNKMAASISARLFACFCLLSGSAWVCLAQRGYVPPPPPLTTLPPCPVPKDAKDAKKIAKRKDCDPTNRPLPQAAAAPTATSSTADTAAQKFPYPGNQPASPANASASAAKAFPYPGEAPAAAAPSAPAKQFPYPGDTTSDDPGRANPNVPHDPAAEKKAADTSAGKAFPYPGDPAPAASPDPNGSVPSPESSSSSASSSSSSGDDDNSKTAASKNHSSDDDDDDDQPKLADKGSEGKRTKKTAKPQTDSERVDEDLSVARFYGQSGNPMGAYLRAKDAVKTEPDLPEARFVMAEAAKQLKKTEEAKAEFGEYLKLAPDGEHAKAAEKALLELR